MNTEIKIFLDSPHLFQLQPELVSILGKEVASRQEIVAGLWEYIKAKNLQDKETKNFVNCDALLRKIFETDYIKMDMISLSLKKQIKGLEPFVIPYSAIKGSTIQENEKIIDLKIEFEPPTTYDSMPFFVSRLVLDPQYVKNVLNNTAKAHPNIKDNEKIKNINASVGPLI